MISRGQRYLANGVPVRAVKDRAQRRQRQRWLAAPVRPSRFTMVAWQWGQGGQAGSTIVINASCYPAQTNFVVSGRQLLLIGGVLLLPWRLMVWHLPADCRRGPGEAQRAGGVSPRGLH